MQEFTNFFKMPEVDVVKVFEEIDVENKGYIEYSQFTIAALNHSLYINDNSLKQAFATLDKDDSGELEMQELHEALGITQD